MNQELKLLLKDAKKSRPGGPAGGVMVDMHHEIVIVKFQKKNVGRSGGRVDVNKELELL